MPPTPQLPSWNRVATAGRLIRTTSTALGAVAIGFHTWHWLGFSSALQGASPEAVDNLWAGFRAGLFVGVMVLVVGVAVCAGVVFHGGVALGRLQERRSDPEREHAMATFDALVMGDKGPGWQFYVAAAMTVLGTIAFMLMIVYAAGG